jgi:phage regulator Rha-like protein
MEQQIVLENNIENKIFTIRNTQIMLDSDLAKMYGVETKVLNQAVKRNIERFPDTFRFQLTDEEFGICSRSQIVTLNNDAKVNKLQRGQNIKYKHVAFTEQGVAMLSAILRSDTAIQVSIQVINAFVGMRKMLIHNAVLLQRLEYVEHKQIITDNNVDKIFTALESGNITPKQDIFFNGQIYDAYSFVIQLISKANKSIILIDNYVDATVLEMLTKKQKNVNVQIITQANTPIKAIDITKFNQQYPTVSISYSTNFHDRFLLIDRQELYHIGASLKDLGKKCFAFSLIDEKQLIQNLLSNI